MLNGELGQKQIVTQKLVRSASILQMNVTELEIYLQNLAMENPFIELDENTYENDQVQMECLRKTDWWKETDYQNRIYYKEENQEWYQKTEGDALTLSAYLRMQLLERKFTPQNWAILEYLTESLDERGYYTEGLDLGAEVLHVPQHEIGEMLEIIKGLDPPGVGAENFQECLLLQLKRRTEDTTIAEEIVVNCLEQLSKNAIAAIAKKTKHTIEDVQAACCLIHMLNPKPGGMFATGELTHYIQPDILLIKGSDQNQVFHIILQEGIVGSFAINEYYYNLMQETQDAETRHYLQEKLVQVHTLQEEMEERKNLLYRVVQLIVKYQAAFFMQTENYKRPLKLSDLAEELQVHESTVSRALKGKYLQCARGIYPLRYFLTGAAATTEDCETQKSHDEVKAAILRIIEGEDKRKPLSDGAIQKLLEKEKICLARRTVNKYRQELGIPDKMGRKIWLHM